MNSLRRILSFSPLYTPCPGSYTDRAGHWTALRYVVPVFSSILFVPLHVKLVDYRMPVARLVN